MRFLLQLYVPLEFGQADLRKGIGEIGMEAQRHADLGPAFRPVQVAGPAARVRRDTQESHDAGLARAFKDRFAVFIEV